MEEVAGQVVDALVAGLSGVLAAGPSGQGGRRREAMAQASGR